MGFASRKSFILLTLLFGLLVHVPATESWFFQAEDEEVTTPSITNETTISHTTPTPPSVIEDNAEVLNEKQQNKDNEEISVEPTEVGEITLEQDMEEEDLRLFTTRKEGLVPAATDKAEEGDLDAKKETELDIEFIVVTTDKTLKKNSTSQEEKVDQHDALKAHKDTSPTSQEENEEESLMAVAGSGDIDEEMYEVTSSDPSAEHHEEVTETIIVHEEGSDLEAAPETYTTAEDIILSAAVTHAPEPETTEEAEVTPMGPMKGGDKAHENTLDSDKPSSRKTRRPRPHGKVTPRPDHMNPRPPKMRKAPMAAVDIPDKPTTMRQSVPPPSTNEELPLSTPAQEVIINHRNSTKSGLSLAAKTGIAGGSLIAFWLILGPIVCCLCRMKDNSKDAPSKPHKGEGTNGALMEHVVVSELAKGRDKKYQTSVENDQEITTLNQVNHDGNTKVEV